MSYIGAEPSTAAFAFDQFSGTGGTNSFTLSQAPASTNSVIAYVDGAIQHPNTYSVTGPTITFNVAPAAGTNNIGVLFLGLPGIVGVPDTGTVTPAMLSSGGPSWNGAGALTAVDLKPVTDNTGVVGDAALTWSNGNFTNLTVDSTLTVRAAIDLADSDVLRMGSSDDWALYYNGTTNKGQIEMEASCLGIQFTDNGTERAYIDKATGDFSATSFSGAGTGLTGTAASLTIGGNSANVTGTVAVANGGTGATSLAANNVILGNNGSAVQVVAPGTTGNVLTSNGTTWTSASISAGLPGTQGQVFTSTGTFTVPTGVTSVKVTVTGGGGNGGTATGTGASAGGGGAGGTAIKYVTGLTPGGTVAVTVGGIAGTSSFGAYCSATGGATAVTASGGGTSTAGGAGGAGSSGDINLNGGSGSAAGQAAVSDAAGSGGGTNASSGLTAIVKTASGCCAATVYSYGQAGNGLIGNGGRSAGAVAPRNGGAATGFGNGGGGAIADGTTDRTGGAGTAGIVIVEW